MLGSNLSDNSLTKEFNGVHVAPSRHKSRASQDSQQRVDRATADLAQAMAYGGVAPLTDEQQDASDQLYSDCMGGGFQGWNFGLQAGAGCGKSFTAAHPAGFLAQLMKTGFRVGIATPTHIAANVCREYLLEAGIDIEPRTLHSILGMKQVRRGGEQTFAPSGKSALGLYDVLLIDESSMISPQLFDEAQKQREEQVFIWMGDPHQLPPVAKGNGGFAISPALDSSRLDGVSELKETHRFGGPLLEKATRLRTKPLEWKARWEASGESIRTVADEFKLKDAFGEQLIASDGTVRMLAYTNAAVDYWNKIAHLRIYGAGTDRFMEGMKLLTREPITPNAVDDEELSARERAELKGQFTLWGASYELEILNVEQKKVFLYDQPQDIWPKFKTWLICAKSPISNQVHWFRVLHESEHDRFKSCLSFIADMAKEKERGEDERKELWGIFWRWKESFADVQPAYCSTVHRAQGQGIDHVFLDLDDLRKPGKYQPKMAKALMYTAATRARKSITTVGV